jgi:hypothetical protein
MKNIKISIHYEYNKNDIQVKQKIFISTDKIIKSIDISSEDAEEIIKAFNLKARPTMKTDRDYFDLIK